MISGVTNSRLIELKKYGFTELGSVENKYHTSNTITKNGVDISKSTSGETVYYISGIEFHDNIVDNETIYYFQPTTKETLVETLKLAVNREYYKDLNKLIIRNNPKITNDVFIERQEISVFELLHKLSSLEDLNEVIAYAGGNYFNIVNNI